MIGREAREQILAAEGRLPEVAVACVGGGSNAIGLFAGFVDDSDVRLLGVEAAGAASLGPGRIGVLHGARSSLLADEDGQVLDAHSISAGLDYPGVGPEHAFLRDSGRAEYVAPTTTRRSRPSGTSPEPKASSRRSSRRMPSRARASSTRSSILVCLSGRGDKDLAEVVGR